MVNPVLLIAVPLGLAFAIPLFALFWKDAAKYIPPAALGFNLVISLILLTHVFENPVIVSEIIFLMDHRGKDFRLFFTDIEVK